MNRSLPLTLLCIGVPLLLAGLFLWLLLHSGEKEAQEALRQGRIVTIALPDGLVQGGISSKNIRPPTPAKATPEETLTALVPPSGEGLSAAPFAAITETTEDGPLPLIAEDGTRAWHFYARPFEKTPESESAPKIAIVVTGLGFSKDATDAALRLPASASLSFSPYVPDAALWAASARALGHEVLVDLPLEPADFPATDPGPQALFSHLAPEVNTARLRWVLSRFAGHIGVVAGFSERFIANAEAAEAPLKTLQSRGLLLVLSGTNVPDATSQLLDRLTLPYVAAAARVEEESTLYATRHQLMATENDAQKTGQALLVIPATPATLAAVAEWVETLGKKGFILVPVSALARLKFS